MKRIINIAIMALLISVSISTLVYARLGSRSRTFGCSEGVCAAGRSRASCATVSN